MGLFDILFALKRINYDIVMSYFGIVENDTDDRSVRGGCFSPETFTSESCNGLRLCLGYVFISE